MADVVNKAVDYLLHDSVGIVVDKQTVNDLTDRIMASLHSSFPKDSVQALLLDPSKHPRGSYTLDQFAMSVEDAAGTAVQLMVMIVVQTSTSLSVVIGGGIGFDPGGMMALVVYINGTVSPVELYDPSVAAQLRGILSHELAHVKDPFVSKDSGRPQPYRTGKHTATDLLPSDKDLDLAKYYNDPHEIRAYLSEIKHEMSYWRQEWAQPKFAHFVKVRGGFNKFVVYQSPTYVRMEPHLTAANKKYILSRLYNYLVKEQ